MKTSIRSLEILFKTKIKLFMFNLLKMINETFSLRSIDGNKLFLLERINKKGFSISKDIDIDYKI